MLVIWALLLGAAFPAQAQTLTGRWDGTVVIENMKVPFSMHFDAAGEVVKGSFYKGEQRVASSGGSFKEGVLRLAFAQFGTELEARLVDSSLKGTYGTHRLEASAYCTCAYEGEAGPDVSGTWQAEDLRVVIRRKGEDTYATIHEAGNALGEHTGRFDGLQFTLNYFDGAKGSVLELTPQKDHSLEVVWKRPGTRDRKLTAKKS